VPARVRHAVARLTIIACALVLAACSAPMARSATEPARVLLGSGSSMGRSLAVGQRTGTFRIAGSASKLYPGATVPLVLTVTNAQPFVIEVTSLTVKVSNASAKCAGTNLKASSFTGRLRVPARRSAKTTLHLTMQPSALDGCQGAHFPLSFSGLARQAP
jgi:hypothetical protein